PDDESATVNGIITSDGLFEGTVSTSSEEYHIEPVNRYVSPGMREPTFHSIVYKTSDVQDPRKGQPCASHRLSLKKYEEENHLRKKRWLLEAEAKLPFDDPPGFFFPSHNRTRRPFTSIFDISQPIDEELEMTGGNRTTIDISNLIFRNVNKRATVDPKKTTCMLYLQADHQFFSKYGTEEACIEVMTRHVQRVNYIYKNT
ncbi:unnamed protein product, partial [Callosobruchus maculatus]